MKLKRYYGNNMMAFEPDSEARGRDIIRFNNEHKSTCHSGDNNFMRKIRMLHFFFAK